MSSGVTLLTVRGFFRFPSSKTRMVEETKNSALLKSLWSQNEVATSLNAPTTLPMELKTKTEIYDEVKLANPEKMGIFLTAKQGFAYGKELMKFYRTGITNVWNNKSVMNDLMKSHKITRQVNNKGDDVDIQIPNFIKLTQELALSLSMNQIENRAINERRNEVRHKHTSNQTKLFNLSRSQFQLINRTSQDFYKIPFFVIICLIFVETTPLLCYAIPQVTPSTCVLPSIVPRLWNANASIKLANIRNTLDQQQLEKLALKTAYNLPLNQVQLLCKALRLTFKFIPIQLYPQSLLRTRLNNYYNYLKVDNYYLSGFNNGNIWDLSDQELFNACLERNLIKDFSKFDEINKIKDQSLKTQSLNAYYDELRIKLFKFIIDFENYNVGYLGLTHVIDQPNQIEVIMKWRI
jgi:pentamidine resistance factor